MFFISRDKKLALMFIGCMTLSLLRMDIPLFNTANFFFVACFLMSEFENIKTMLMQFVKKPVGLTICIVLLSFIICVVFSPHLDSIQNTWFFFRSELLLKYFVLGYAFYSIRNEKNLRVLIRYSIIPMYILTVFGVINLLEKHSSFVTEMMSNWDLNSMSESYALKGDRFVDSDRFRVQAMFWNPFDYGYICTLCLLMYIYGYTKKMIRKTRFSILLLCCSFGILMCGARTVLFISIIGVGIFILLSYKLGKAVTVGLVTILLFVMAYMTIPVMSEKVNEMASIFTDVSGQQVQGSNIDMRSVQFATTLYYIQDSPAFGRGVNFFYIDMGWGTGEIIDHRLEGIEGVYLMYLLERGVVGYCLYLLVWIVMLVYLVGKKHENKTLSAFGVAVWAVYMIFAHMTGELSSVFPTLLIIGGIIGVLTPNPNCYGIKK